MWQENYLCWWCQQHRQNDLLGAADPLDSWEFFELCRMEGRQISPLFECPLAGTGMILLDWLHLVELGIGADLCGNILGIAFAKSVFLNREAWLDTLNARLRAFNRRAKSPLKPIGQLSLGMINVMSFVFTWWQQQMLWSVAAGSRWVNMLQRLMQGSCGGSCPNTICSATLFGGGPQTWTMVLAWWGEGGDWTRERERDKREETEQERGRDRRNGWGTDTVFQLMQSNYLRWSRHEKWSSQGKPVHNLLVQHPCTDPWHVYRLLLGNSPACLKRDGHRHLNQGVYVRVWCIAPTVQRPTFTHK